MFTNEVLSSQAHLVNIDRHLIVRRVVTLEGVNKVPLVDPVPVSFSVGAIPGVKTFVDPLGLFYQNI